MFSSQSLRSRYDRLDEQMVGFMSDKGISLLRISLAVIFIWFGVLKVIGLSPVAELVASTVPWIPSVLFVPFLGIWEVIVGLGLLFSWKLRLILLLFWLQMAGTFLVLLTQPDIAYQGGNPLLLTTEGEFVIKNLILITAGLVVGSTVRRSDRQEMPAEEGQSAPQ